MNSKNTGLVYRKKIIITKNCIFFSCYTMNSTAEQQITWHYEV